MKDPEPATLDEVLVELQAIRELLERENICPHGGTGLCMYCLAPQIEAIGSQITNQVFSSLSNVGRARSGW